MDSNGPIQSMGVSRWRAGRVGGWCAALLIMTVALGAGGCGAKSSSSASGGSSQTASKPEVSPAGDIPDNQAFVAFAPASGAYSVKVPEGWSKTTNGGRTTFTDKLNAIQIESWKSRTTPTVATVKSNDVPRIAKSVNGFQLQSVAKVQRSSGPVVRVTYLQKSKPDEVTGKSTVTAVERYSFYRNGKTVVLTLSGAKGADNVDPWKIVTDSFRWG